MTWFEEHFVNILGLFGTIGAIIIGYWKLHADLIRKVTAVEQDLSDFHDSCKSYHTEYDAKMEAHISDAQIHSHKEIDDYKSTNLTHAIDQLKMELRETTLTATKDMRELEEKITRTFHAEHDRTRQILSNHIMDQAVHQSEGERAFRTEWRESVMQRLTGIEMTMTELLKATIKS